MTNITESAEGDAESAVLVSAGGCRIDIVLRDEEEEVMREEKARLEGLEAKKQQAAEGLSQVRRRLQNLVSEKAMVEQQLAQLGDRRQTFSVAGKIEGNVHPDLLHFRRLLEPRDGGREFLVTREKGLIDRAAPASE